MSDRLKAIGSFVLAFGHTERLLISLLWSVAGLSPLIARAILPSPPLNTVLEKLKRIDSMSHFDKRAKSVLKEALEHLAPITHIRNQIVHYGISHTGVTSKFATALTEDGMHLEVVTVENINQMIADLMKINGLLTLYVATCRIDAPRVVPTDADYAALSQAAWQYKYVSVASRWKKPRTNRQKPRSKR